MKEVKELFIKARFFVKSSRSVVLDVVSGDTQYRVTLNVNGSHTCTCEGNAVYHRVCKHIKLGVEKEPDGSEVKTFVRPYEPEKASLNGSNRGFSMLKK